MHDSNTNTTEAAAHGRHRGNPAPQEDPSPQPHGRHRRDEE